MIHYTLKKLTLAVLLAWPLLLPAQTFLKLILTRQLERSIPGYTECLWEPIAEIKDKCKMICKID